MASMYSLNHSSVAKTDMSGPPPSAPGAPGRRRVSQPNALSRVNHAASPGFQLARAAMALAAGPSTQGAPDGPRSGQLRQDEREPDGVERGVRGHVGEEASPPRVHLGQAKPHEADHHDDTEGVLPG